LKKISLIDCDICFFTKIDSFFLGKPIKLDRKRDKAQEEKLASLREFYNDMY
jgi:hypothetical protein